MILLDTSVLVAAYRRSSAAGRKSETAAALRQMIESGVSLGISATALQEVLAGVRDRAQFQELRTHLSAFRILAADVDDHVAAAQLAGKCAEKGIPCTSQAALVVTQAARGGWQLWTLDGEMAAVARAANVRLARTRETASESRRGT